MTKQIGLGIVKGLGLKSGAIATTIAHDSHNLIIAVPIMKIWLWLQMQLKACRVEWWSLNKGKFLLPLELPIAWADF